MNKCRFMFAGVVTFLLGVLLFGAFGSSPKNSSPWVAPIVSEINDLEITDVRVSNPMNPFGTVYITIKNNSSKSVKALNFSYGNNYSLPSDGAGGLGQGTSLIAPGGEYTMDIWLARTKRDVPIRLNAAIYADGSVVGNENLLKVMRMFTNEESIPAK